METIESTKKVSLRPRQRLFAVSKPEILTSLQVSRKEMRSYSAPYKSVKQMISEIVTVYTAVMSEQNQTAAAQQSSNLEAKFASMVPVPTQDGNAYYKFYESLNEDDIRRLDASTPNWRSLYGPQSSSSSNR